MMSATVQYEMIDHALTRALKAIYNTLRGDAFSGFGLKFHAQINMFITKVISAGRARGRTHCLGGTNFTL